MNNRWNLAKQIDSLYCSIFDLDGNLVQSCCYPFPGDNCNDDLDGCADHPCIVGTNCTDLTPVEQVAQNTAFTCSECPHGYTKNDGICVGT